MTENYCAPPDVMLRMVMVTPRSLLTTPSYMGRYRLKNRAPHPISKGETPDSGRGGIEPGEPLCHTVDCRFGKEAVHNDPSLACGRQVNREFVGGNRPSRHPRFNDARDCRCNGVFCFEQIVFGGLCTRRLAALRNVRSPRIRE